MRKITDQEVNLALKVIKIKAKSFKQLIDNELVECLYRDALIDGVLTGYVSSGCEFDDGIYNKMLEAWELQTGFSLEHKED